MVKENGFGFVPHIIKNIKCIEDYYSILQRLQNTNPEEKEQILRFLCQNDLFFLIWYGFNRKDIAHPWLFARCREVQENPNGYLDLWARTHYKSTIITFGKTIQDILNNPEITIGIFSHTRPIAKSFLKQIKRELELNEILKNLFPDILWKHPHKEAPKWSDDEGIIIKRKNNPKESTVEAWGVVDGQPISKHFDIIVYDDIVTAESVTTPEMTAKTQERWELSLNLMSNNGVCRYIGTRYSFNDLYKTIIERKTAIPRIYPATIDGTMNGEPVFLTKEDLQIKKRDGGVYTFSSQMLQNPVADSVQGFRKEWLNYYECQNERLISLSKKMNVYILVDAASDKKKTSDYTVMVVIGCHEDENYYLLDGIRDRLNLREKGDMLFNLYKKWKPIAIGYEKYGLMADTEYLREKQERENFRFKIIELGGPLSKNDRIRKLVPIFESNRFYLPLKLIKLNYEGKSYDFVKQFEHEEYLIFPSGVHDDMLDAISRIKDISHEFPIEEEDSDLYYEQEYDEISGEPL